MKLKGTIKMLLTLRVMVDSKKRLRYLNREDALSLLSKLDIKAPANMKKSNKEYILALDVKNILFKEYIKFSNKKVDFLMNGILQVGFIPLIDEATGYQNIRAKNELIDRFNKRLED